MTDRPQLTKRQIEALQCAAKLEIHRSQMSRHRQQGRDFFNHRTIDSLVRRGLIDHGRFWLTYTIATAGLDYLAERRK